MRANMVKEEVARCVVDNDSGKAGFASDDAPCAVPSSVSTLKSPVTSKRRKWGDSAFEELFIDPIIYEVFPFPWAGDQSEIH